jgi:hypothetical protein
MNHHRADRINITEAGADDAAGDSCFVDEDPTELNSVVWHTGMSRFMIFGAGHKSLARPTRDCRDLTESDLLRHRSQPSQPTVG